MTQRWSQKKILGILAGWYLFTNCLMPLFHHHSERYTQNLGLGSEPVCCQTAHISHDTHDPHAMATGISQVSSPFTVHGRHLCSFCTYLNQLQPFKRLQSRVWTHVPLRSRPRVLCENTDHIISSQWCTCIILRGPPSEPCWDTRLA